MLMVKVFFAHGKKFYMDIQDMQDKEK